MLLTKGTMQLGGYLALRYEHHADANDYVNGTNFEVAPYFGYFLADQFELTLHLSVMKGIGQLFEDFPLIGSLLIGVKYHFPVGKAFMYLGAEVGMRGDYDEELYKYVALAVPLGFLIPLNYHLAIDIGLYPNAAFSLEGDSYKVVSVPVGYLGVQGYF